MSRFRYCGDPLFLVGCAAYVINRWLVKPHIGPGFLMFHFNDFWLIPCALPVMLWVHRRMGWRLHDEPPQAGEIVGHLVFWSMLLEWIGPKFVAHAQGDLGDVIVYAAGALVAMVWWWRERLVAKWKAAFQMG